jgi:hypothetical protein
MKLDVVIVAVLEFTSVPGFPDSVSNTVGGDDKILPGVKGVLLAGAVNAKLAVTPVNRTILKKRFVAISRTSFIVNILVERSCSSGASGARTGNVKRCNE